MRAILIMPFSTDFDDVHKAICYAAELCRKRAAENEEHPRKDVLMQLEVHRVDEGHGAESIMADLLSQMSQAQLCIADISGSNPNVLWELGYAMALKKPTIIISQSINTAPFDVKSFRCLPYARDQLNDTLVEQLTSEIFNLMWDVPEVFVFPDELGHAQTLAMSTASPAYFLDENFNIHYMNEAAVALFLADRSDTASSWVNKSLTEFITSFNDRLVNFAAIEKNLQLQKEKLRRAGNAAPASPLNVELVILDTTEYGIVELQKTGVAVRNPTDGRITGWVVSFNLIKARDPEKYAEFHIRHKAVLQGRLLGMTNPRRDQVKSTIPAGEWSTWQDEWSTDVPLERANGYSEKQACCEYMSSVMTIDKERYGLESVEFLEDWFFDYKRTEYLMMKHGSIVVGVLRLHIDHDMSKYTSLKDEVLDLWRDGQKFADAGAYFHKSMSAEARRHHMARMLGHGFTICEDRGVTHLYAQVPKRQVPNYAEFGFEVAGESFECKGWQDKLWMPIYAKNWNFGVPTPGRQTEAGLQFRQDFQAGVLQRRAGG